MNRLLLLIASIGLAGLAISSTCIASPTDWSVVAPGSPALTANGGGFAAWPSSEGPSRLIGGGLLSL